MFIGFRWVYSCAPWGSLDSFWTVGFINAWLGVVEFIRARRRVHSGCFGSFWRAQGLMGSFRLALVVVGFIWVCRIFWVRF